MSKTSSCWNLIDFMSRSNKTGHQLALNLTLEDSAYEFNQTNPFNFYSFRISLASLLKSEWFTDDFHQYQNINS